ncbi:multidrug effflux MFS transporter [Acidocella sp. KAb 2-4]|uniref:multidrug effflux MFS transporter n=1 Tax=Acidocella sp. KAb 2-4 TaxID=2885158 RepID=UPI001D090013|nr:multidrug effflux MFS transporter [Acidocella sp. KAb 2-4]MCB5943887.1 multidrug effflux MFS transporter [Acidocella sp. KAb 2-4]
MVRRVTTRLPLLLGFLIAIGPVSTDMYLPAFPQIAREFHNAAAPQYSLAAYFVGLAIGQMTQGALSDRLGRRVPLLAGLVLYTFATIGCWLSWSVSSLVVFRFLTALGASAGTVIPRAMVRDLADGPEAAKLFSKLMLVMGVAPITAPMLGAAVVGWLSWRVIFAVCALYGVVAVVLAWRYLPDTLPRERRTLIGAGAVLLRYVHIFREPAFLSHAMIGAATSACLFAYLAATPQIFIGEYDWSSAGYALLFGVNSTAYIAYSQINPLLVNRFGLAPVITASVAVQLAASLYLSGLALHPFGALPIAGGLLIAEIGFGLLTPCAMVGALSRHQAHAGSAAALLGTMQYTGGAIAGLAVGVLADGTSRPMAFAMLGCAVVALLAARRRPSLSFSPAE